MAERIQGITIEIAGDATPLTQALRSVDDASKSTSRELGQINRALKFDEGNTVLLSQRFEVLQERVQQTQGRLDLLRGAQEEVNRAFAAGEIDGSEYRQFQREIEQTQGILENFQRQAQDTRVRIDGQVELSGLEKARQDIRDLGSAAAQVGSEIGSSISAGAAVGVAALGGLSTAGQDVAQRLAAVDAVASTLGFDNSAGQIENLAVGVASFTGDLEGAIEGVSNLLNTDFSQSQLEEVLRLTTGAALEFRETLNFEGIADGLQETLAIGEGAGSFAEYLERSGVVLEDFNAGLELARKAGTDVDFVFGVLANGTNAQGVLETFEQQNQALIDSQAAQAQFAIASAELSVALAPLLTTLASLAVTVLDFINNTEGLAPILAVVLGAITLVSGAVAIFGPILGVIAKVAPTVGRALLGLTGPIGIVVAAVLGIITVFNLVRNNLDSIGGFFKTVFDGISRGVTAFVNGFKSGFDRLVTVIKKPLNNVAELINKFIRGLNKLQLPDFLGGGGVNIPEIPRFARGTNYFRGGPALVGEEGPEIVNLPEGASVTNARNTSRILGGQNEAMTINIPLVIDGREFASATAQYMNGQIYNISQNTRRGGRL